ncbi:hypothetical protein pdam_00001965 [Pocillopora damicornis]|uniref:Uncharacterized protein n=1 Tax=Pocillopora damicornis TaxID=46731 RepID=A0A3M6TQ10_POCDA|nr:hypothetical protein pdam_00001965 [Pocillopora damicornis]
MKECSSLGIYSSKRSYRYREKCEQCEKEFDYVEAHSRIVHSGRKVKCLPVVESSQLKLSGFFSKSSAAVESPDVQEPSEPSTPIDRGIQSDHGGIAKLEPKSSTSPTLTTMVPKQPVLPKYPGTKFSNEFFTRQFQPDWYKNYLWRSSNCMLSGQHPPSKMSYLQ